MIRNSRNILTNEKGFNIIEVLIATSIISILVVIAGNIAGEFAIRRSIDNLTHNMTSQINLVKLRASRNGVEHRVIINFDPDEQKLNVETRAGDSNINSSNFSDDDSVLNSINYKTLSNYTLVPSNQDIIMDFRPNGTLAGLSNVSIIIHPIDEEAEVRKCGRITVTPLGRVRVIVGRWDHDETDQDIACRPIIDKQEQPS